MSKDKVYVATVNVTNRMEELTYTPLGRALAPLGVYITPIVQDANYQNKTIYNNKMSVEDFLLMIENLRPFKKGNIQLKRELDKEKKVHIYANKDIYEDSTYALRDFTASVYGQEELPIIF